MADSVQSFLSQICEVALKAIHILVSKAEGMIMTGSDAEKMSAQNSFGRTSQQEHNVQLVILLCQLKVAFEAMPQRVLKVAKEISNFGANHLKHENLSNLLLSQIKLNGAKGI